MRSEGPGVVDYTVPKRENIVAVRVVLQRLAVDEWIRDVLLRVTYGKVILVRKIVVDLRIALIAIDVTVLRVDRVGHEAWESCLGKDAHHLESGRAQARDAGRRSHLLAGTANGSLRKIGWHHDCRAGVLQFDIRDVGEIP